MLLVKDTELFEEWLAVLKTAAKTSATLGYKTPSGSLCLSPLGALAQAVLNIQIDLNSIYLWADKNIAGNLFIKKYGLNLADKLGDIRWYVYDVPEEFIHLVFDYVPTDILDKPVPYVYVPIDFFNMTYEMLPKYTLYVVSIDNVHTTCVKWNLDSFALNTNVDYTSLVDMLRQTYTGKITNYDIFYQE